MLDEGETATHAPYRTPGSRTGAREADDAKKMPAERFLFWIRNNDRDDGDPRQRLHVRESAGFLRGVGKKTRQQRVCICKGRLIRFSDEKGRGWAW
ncbi:hypothetical protein D5366_04460 [Neokomagataea tanensis]|uniref:Uncharacterized protein n=1 Tax=Neokomagataea tanensis TaxID=661191 RepID=A0A4Y6V822_9PROT|nr:hypothetical protein D5366_04460 [Neokomagataea tanensis]